MLAQAPRTTEQEEELSELGQVLADMSGQRYAFMADGGRIGLKDGPKMFDIQASGTKSGKQQIEGAPEGFTIDDETINAIVKADIPISEKINILADYQYGKGRTRMKKDNQKYF